MLWCSRENSIVHIDDPQTVIIRFSKLDYHQNPQRCQNGGLESPNTNNSHDSPTLENRLHPYRWSSGFGNLFILADRRGIYQDGECNDCPRRHASSETSDISLAGRIIAAFSDRYCYIPIKIINLSSTAINISDDTVPQHLSIWTPIVRYGEAQRIVIDRQSNPT